MGSTNVGRLPIAAPAVRGIVARLAHARNDSGVGGRLPDPEDVRAVVVAHGARAET